MKHWGMGLGGLENFTSQALANHRARVCKSPVIVVFDGSGYREMAEPLFLPFKHPF